MKQTFKLAWHNIKQNRLYSTLYVLGASLSIMLTMIVAIIWILLSSDQYPENNKSRILSIKSIKLTGEVQPASYLSYTAHEKLLRGIEEIEARTNIWSAKADICRVAIPTENKINKSLLKYVDPGFWQVFNFEFLYGAPFTSIHSETELKHLVISASYAKEVFNREDVVGEKLVVDKIEYIIGGVVRTPPKSALTSYSKLWAPVSLMQKAGVAYPDFDLTGPFHLYFSVRDGSDLEVVIQKIHQNLAKENSTIKHSKSSYTLMGQPDKYQVSLLRYYSNAAPDIDHYLIMISLLILAVLIIPAINLSGMISSSINRRLDELAIRKAFGARSQSIFLQIVNENLLLSAIGACLGLLFAYIILLFAFEWIIMQLISTASFHVTVSDDHSYDLLSLFNPWIFISVVMITLLLNLTAALIPAWKAKNKNIVECLNSAKR